MERALDHVQAVAAESARFTETQRELSFIAAS
jgi:hypothetical protein